MTVSPEMNEEREEVAKFASLRNETDMKEALTKLKVTRDSIVTILNELAEVMEAGPYCESLNGKLTFELAKTGAD